jgi:hypothetical protein
VLIHRLFCGVGIALGNGIGDLGMALKCELLADLVTLDLFPTLHKPIDHDRMNGTENRITRNLKENPVELDVGLHEQSVITDGPAIRLQRIL